MEKEMNIIHHIFEAAAKKYSEESAIIYEEGSLTYRELNERSNQLARILCERGVGLESVVAVLIERSVEMWIAIMATLKAGGAYLPISPDYPLERIEYILDNSKTKIILSRKHMIEKYHFNITAIDVEDPEAYHSDITNLNIPCSPCNLAYIIYTSGSTGNPKGVMIEHASVANRIHWMQKEYPMGDTDIVLQKTPITFDVSVWELFWWFFSNSKLFLIKHGDEKNVEAIIETIERHKITVMHFIPSMFNLFLDYIRIQDYPQKVVSLRQVFCSGEILNPSHLEKFNRLLYREGRIRLINLYGPTEAAVDVTHYECGGLTNLKTVPIGKAIDNITIHIVDKNGRLCDTGESGELCIAGIGVGRGYVNAVKLTEEKFLASPFTEGDRMYRSGDLARRMSDGNIEFLGRMDKQVKIRGYRIELDEIEYHILKHPSVKEAVVLAQDTQGVQNMLAVYIVFHQKTSIMEIKRYLQKKLPDYMIPTAYTVLEALPYNANGKIDCKKLQELR